MLRFPLRMFKVPLSGLFELTKKELDESSTLLTYIRSKRFERVFNLKGKFSRWCKNQAEDALLLRGGVLVQ